MCKNLEFIINLWWTDHPVIISLKSIESFIFICILQSRNFYGYGQALGQDLQTKSSCHILVKQHYIVIIKILLFLQLLQPSVIRVF